MVKSFVHKHGPGIVISFEVKIFVHKHGLGIDLSFGLHAPNFSLFLFTVFYLNQLFFGA